MIFLSILSSCSSFFNSPDDMTALSEIITLFGSDAIEKVANSYGRCIYAHLVPIKQQAIAGYKFICSEYKCGMNLQNLSCSLRLRGTDTDMGSTCEKCHLPSYTCRNSSMEVVGLI